MVHAVPNGDGVCFCLPEFKEGLNKSGETTCKKIGSDDSDRGKLLLIMILATVIVALMTLVAMVAMLAKRSFHHRRHTDVTWHIKLSELKFSDPPMILGGGTFGQVRRVKWGERRTPHNMGFLKVNKWFTDSNVP
jgi:hypothetical protein